MGKRKKASTPSLMKFFQLVHKIQCRLTRRGKVRTMFYASGSQSVGRDPLHLCVVATGISTKADK
ncbi:hypothetical protein T4E_182 [Trichinella pseudospiralis]|uniref:Uncharacterized protein n=1 Tax=Trichinella pseudospiralis TaxID=6337 RepID=A0A0V0Y6Y0_TRIPS|nr:hypothetical protein T4E_182 [Trichinella pseudospiralis]